MVLPTDWKTRHYPKLDTEGIAFSQVMELGDNYEVYDFSKGYDAFRELKSTHGVGKYDELRPGMYLGDQFTKDQRDLHIGIDLAGPAGTPVFIFYDGTIFKVGDNALPYDYGPTIITQHQLNGQTLYALHGHLSKESLEKWSPGDSCKAGTQLATLGTEEVNGGWNPHLHFQLSWIEPITHDLPGTVNAADRDAALKAFPDPRAVLGQLYTD